MDVKLAELKGRPGRCGGFGPCGELNRGLGGWVLRRWSLAPTDPSRRPRERRPVVVGGGRAGAGW